MPARLEVVADQESGRIVAATSREVINGTRSAVGTEIRRSVSGPQSRYPSRRKRGRAREPGRKATIRYFRARRRGPIVRLLNESPPRSDGSRVPFVIEFNQTIRGQRNEHFRSVYRTIQRDWPNIGRRAQARAVRNIANRAVRNTGGG